MASFADNLQMIKKGVYGHDVRQAIYEIIEEQATLITTLEKKVSEITGSDISGDGSGSGGGDTNIYYGGNAICGLAVVAGSGAVTDSFVTKKF